MKLLKSGLLVVLGLFSFLSVAEQTTPISQQALLKLMADSPANMIVLDVRTPKEFQSGHIEGAVNVRHDQINENLKKILSYKDKTVVVHCRSGRRAATAENALRAAGFSDLRHLEGDMNGWVSANLPIIK